jgi:hypothetical protein
MSKLPMKRFFQGVGRAMKTYLQHYPDFTPRKDTAYRDFERTAKAIERMCADENAMMRGHFEAAGFYMRRAMNKELPGEL